MAFLCLGVRGHMIWAPPLEGRKRRVSSMFSVLKTDYFRDMGTIFYFLSQVLQPLATLLLGRTLPKFTQLKRNKRFDNFIMLVWVQGSPFHIAAGSHPVQEAWGSQDSLYRGQIQKLLQCCREPYQQIPLVITIQKKYSLTCPRRTVL